MPYDHSSLEKKWQTRWLSEKTFAAHNPPFASRKQKKYILDMFPYPSGAGLHVGHPKGYTATDVLARYYSARGCNVLHPMGWDAFGLPAENYAIKTGTHPRITTEANIATFRRQIQSLGIAYDWDREVDTTDPKYYQWTQWIFLKLFEKGLVYEAEMPVNWCPALKAVLANEEVVDGKSEVGGHPVERRNMRQWVLKITEYADKLLEGLNTLDWPEGIKEQQRNWIGKSEGCQFSFAKADDISKKLEVYTTRIDTVYGVTYVVMAPDHVSVGEWITPERLSECQNYITTAKAKSDLDRQNEGKEKTGVFTGSYAVNPFNGEKVPVWIADYVLGNYGTGAVMAVPAHDERDFLFWKNYRKHGLKIRCVIHDGIMKEVVWTGNDFGTDEKSFEDWCLNWRQWGELTSDKFYPQARLVNTWEFDGLHPDKAKEIFTEKAEKEWFGKKKVNYKLRDWIFSRQRYWGEPMPIIHLKKKDVDSLLTLKKEDGVIQSHEVLIEWSVFVFEFYVNGIRKERYLCAAKSQTDFDEISQIYDCAIDTYVILDKNLPLKLPQVEKYEPSDDGRSPLANIRDWVEVDVASNLKGERETNTMPQWGGSCWYYLRYMDPHNSEALASREALEYWGQVDHYIGGAEHAVLHLLYARFWHLALFDLGVVPFSEPFQKLTNVGLIQWPDGQKMSKSRWNVINPDDIVKSDGSDTLRMYLMSMSDFRDPAPWNTEAMVGIRRFLERVYSIIETGGKKTSDDMKALKLMHKTIKKVGEDIEGCKFNTAISSLNILLNEGIPSDEEMAAEWKSVFARLLHPFAPHMAEELWEHLGNTTSVYTAPWPEYESYMLVDDEVTIAVQVGGKLRGTFTFLNGVAQEEVAATAYASEEIKKWIEGKEIVREIWVPNKLFSIVVK